MWVQGCKVKSALVFAVCMHFYHPSHGEKSTYPSFFHSGAQSIHTPQPRPVQNSPFPVQNVQQSYLISRRKHLDAKGRKQVEHRFLVAAYATSVPESA
eukprot:1305029-Rhodomonas_salina.3